jgi:Putative transposase DNA-binding domain
MQDLAVSGLARTRPARSVHDACWSTPVRLLEEKALRCRRTVVKVSRWFPSSRLCSAFGFNSGSKPLDVRSWNCPQCEATAIMMSTLPGTSWLKVAESRPAGADSARSWRLRQRRTCPSGCLWKPEPAGVPRERHASNPAHPWPRGCQLRRYPVRPLAAMDSLRAGRGPAGAAAACPPYARAT